MQKQFLGATSALLAIVTLAGAQNSEKEAVKRTTLETLVVSRERGSRISIEITTKDQAMPWVETLDNPARIVVDFPNTVLGAGLGPIPVQTNGVKGIRVGTDAAKTTRVVVDLARLCKYELVPGTGHQMILKLDPTSPAPAPALATGGGGPATPSAPVRSAFLSSPESAPSQSPPSPSAAKDVVTGPASKADPAIALPATSVASAAPAGPTESKANTASPPSSGGARESVGVPAGIGGHVGVVLPLVTRAGGSNTTIADSFSIGFPMGITFHGQGRMAFDMEFVPLIQNSPRQVNLTFHPGLIWAVGHRFSVGVRGAFDANSTQFGFTPLVNKSWPIEGGFFKAYFVEADLPVRFNRPTGLPPTNPVTFAMHFGLGF